MRLRLQADNDLDYRIVFGARRLEPAIDFQTAVEADLHGKPDPVVLAIAATQNRVLASADMKTMPGHFFAFIEKQPFPGVILASRRLPLGRAAELLHIMWAASEAEES